MLEAIFNSAPAIMLVLDKEYRIVKINETGIRLTQISREESSGMQIGKLLKCINAHNHPHGCGHSEACSRCQLRKSFVETCLSNNSKTEASIKVHSTKGEIKQQYYLVAATPLKGHDPATLLLTLEDINLLKEKEAELIRSKRKAEKADHFKTVFLANMSHEIRTPLNGIIGFSEILAASSKLTKKQRQEYSNIIRQCSDSLICIINDILDVSAIENGTLEINLNRVNLSTVLVRLFNVYKAKIKKQGKSIKLSLRIEKTPLLLYTDESRLTQILTNLLDNAIKFTPKGKVSFGIQGINNNQCTLFVSDTGIGIAAQKQALIFDRFRQVETSSCRSYGGNGLGLSIVKEISELLGGHIDVHSEENKGTTFYLQLPLN